jgi:phosphonate transport system substrate-binding protein
MALAASARARRWRLDTVVRSVVAAACLVAVAGVQAQNAADTQPIEVQAGDTFSGIAARITGNLRTWSTLYNAKLSGLPDPNRIQIGMRFELVNDGASGRYLRLLGHRQAIAAAAAAQPSAASARQAPATRLEAPAAVAAAAPAPSAAPAPAPAPAAAPSRAAAAAPLVAAVAAPLVASAAGVAPGADDTLVVGVLPNIAAAALMTQYESLKTYLERQNSQKVRIVLPANFKAFFDGTMRGDFDLAVAAPHFARVAQVDRGLIPLVMYEPRISALFISPLDNPLASPKDVRGKAVGFANPTSLVALYGLQWLRSQGLEPGKDYEVKGARTDMGVGRMMLSGDIAAAVMSNGELRALPADESGRLKIVESFARIPNFIVLAHPRLGPARTARLKAQLKDFITDRDEGAAFVRATGVTGIVDAEEAVLRELDPYVAPTRRAMGYGN